MPRVVAVHKELLHRALGAAESWSAIRSANCFSWLYLRGVSILGTSEKLLPEEEAA